jgi:anti-sigma-K factor RskA
MRGAARRRFEGVLGGNIPARHAVRRWEERLTGLARRAPRVQPSPQVWQHIEARLGRMQAAPVAAKPPSLRLWQALAASVAVIAVALATLLMTRPPEVQVQVQIEKQAVESAHTAVVADATAPIWVVNAFPQLGELRVQALRSVDIASDRSFELWMLPDSGAPPVSLGVIPTTGVAVLPLTPEKIQMLSATSKIAITVEPAGGSPTGGPTGPAPYSAALVHISEQA